MDAGTVAVSPGAIVAALAVGGTLVGVLFQQLFQRLGALEAEIRLVRRDNIELWDYCRRLLDLYYRHRKDGAPEPPELPDLHTVSRVTPRHAK